MPTVGDADDDDEAAPPANDVDALSAPRSPSRSSGAEIEVVEADASSARRPRRASKRPMAGVFVYLFVVVSSFLGGNTRKEKKKKNSEVLFLSF